MWGVTEDSIISQPGNIPSERGHSAELKSPSDSPSPAKMEPKQNGDSSYIPTPDLDASNYGGSQTTRNATTNNVDKPIMVTRLTAHLDAKLKKFRKP